MTRKFVMVMVLALMMPLVAACGGVDVARIISVEGAEPTEMPLGDSGVEIIPLIESIAVIDGISISYPPGWAAQTTEFDGTTLANNQAVLDAFNSDDLPDYNVIGEGNVVMVIQIVPVLDTVNGPELFYQLLQESAEDDGEFAIGEATEVTIGDKEGLLAPLTILDEASGEGLTDVYILQINVEFIALALVIAPGDEMPTGVAETIIASIRLDDTAIAAEATEEPDDIMRATSTVAPPTEAVEVMPTATEMAMEPVEGVELPETLVGDLFTLNYPNGWVAESDLDGITLASSQETFDIADADTDDALQLPDGETAMQVTILPFAASDGTPAEIFDLLFNEVSEDDPFIPGDRSDVTIGGLSGVTSPLEFPDEAAGSGALYILRYDDDNLLLGISLYGGSDLPRATIEAIIASVQLNSE